MLSYLVGRIYRTTPTIMLVLGGVIVSSVFSALISMAKYVADPTNQLPAIVFWLMGSLATARYRDLVIAGIPMLTGVAALLAVRWRINVLSMGDKEAQALGINTTVSKGIVMLVPLCHRRCCLRKRHHRLGGLVIPHIARMLVGSDNRVLIPLA